MSETRPPAPGPDETRVTLVQVAKLAGVSPTTVSHVLSGKRWVAEATQETVREVIRQLGYRPNNVARSLRTRRSRMVAVVVPDITNPFYAVLTRGLADAVDGAGYGSYVCNTDGVPEREDAFLADVRDRGVDGVVMAAGDVTAELRTGPAGLGIPAVCVGGALDDDPHVDLVTPDDGVGSHAAVSHLIRRGARRIGMIEGPEATGSARDEGYRRALREHGLAVEPELMVRGDWTRPGGRAAMHRLLALPPERRPDAVFCANDLTAIGAIDAAHERDLTVPDDVAVVGFDDVDAATIVNPPLTTVRNPAYQTGQSAGELLLSRMTGEYTGEGRTIVLPCPLVVRRSA
ncbi:LacI family DNA-binding transcriptional regulator [Plantactinospora sp. CA-294935]|uniref:LacI family DNA-binding transcriptional regulator n=1 Tax=Plantactinospora sp. CA-294935 TaxID=3240012 RepID=UPI003D91089D